ncbi:hypothetical protein BJ166DRAFT_583166 [Pestalotiopsis sp. NC0098]|nr:hypothetical protein BJ166DRAFT_583166 [Pestalotiopsis sp. NC0098]
MSELRKLLFSLALLGEFNNASSTTLNVTAINARNGKSHFECWALSSPFISSSQSGIVGTQTTHLGDVANITYNTIPIGYESAVHTCPSNEWVMVLKGFAVITLPDNSSSTFMATAGEPGLFFAADTAAVSEKGHGSYFPGVTETIFLQVPTKNGSIPEHEVIYEDMACDAQEYSGLRG